LISVGEGHTPRPFGFRGDLEEKAFRFDSSRYFLTSLGR
jgi:hypothetical protein